MYKDFLFFFFFVFYLFFYDNNFYFFYFGLCILKLIMENKNLQGKISKLIKIQPNSQKYTLFTKIPNIPINQIKTKEKIINYSPPQKIEKT